MMYFAVSKVIGFLITPSNVLLYLALLGLLLWRTRFGNVGKRFTVASILVLLFVGVPPLGSALLLPLENRFPAWNPSHGSPTGMIVLGGVISPELSAQRGEVSLGDAAERLIAAAALNRLYPEARVVLVGGNASVLSDAPSESEFAATLLKSIGVPSDRIEIEKYSRNTAENVSNAFKTVNPKPGERWLLVTSAYHMPRAIGLFRNAGFPVEAYPVDWQTGGWGDLETPSFSILAGLARLDRASHEWVGLIFDRLSGRTSVLFPAP
jgi:uncharacterized SAM-binding protein YcdF (DUF218 family)